jgi:hypothetical protein
MFVFRFSRTDAKPLSVASVLQCSHSVYVDMYINVAMF